jgi:serine acetyltransferase
MNLIVDDYKSMLRYFNYSGFKLFLIFFRMQFWVTILIRLKTTRNQFALPLVILSDLILSIIFGIEVARTCSIGGGLLIPHPRNIILGATSIGKDCLIMTNVVLGASTPDPENNVHKRPKIGNGVLIGTGAVIIGSVKVGDFCVIGANATVYRSIPDGSKVLSMSKVVE